MTVSIVIPVYNAARTIGRLVTQLVDALGDRSLEIVLVNDGSRDASDEECRGLVGKYPGTVVYLKLSRNFGEHGAVMAGLNQARGDHVVIMDDDGQNPPAAVRPLVEHARAHGFDVVYTFYARKQHHWFRNVGSRLNGLCAHFLIGKPRGLYLSSFKCLNGFTVAEIIRYRGPSPYIDALILRTTRNIGAIEVGHDPRREGRSNYTLKKLVALWLDMAAHSATPLRVAGGVCVGSGTMAILAGLLAIAAGLVDPRFRGAWAAAVAAVLLTAGLQSVASGILCEYLGRVSLLSNETPQFIVRERLGAGSRPDPTESSGSLGPREGREAVPGQVPRPGDVPGLP
jgi:hypothetical protein